MNCSLQPSSSKSNNHINQNSDVKGSKELKASSPEVILQVRELKVADLTKSKFTSRQQTFNKNFESSEGLNS